MAPKIIDITHAEPAPAPAASPAPSSPLQLTPPPLSLTPKVHQSNASSPPARLYVATPCYGCQMSTVFMTSLMQLQAQCVQRGIECFCDFVGNESLITRARCVLSARFLKSQSTHLLFIDADIGFNPEAVFRLLESNKDIATAVYPKKAFNWAEIESKLKDSECKEPVQMMGLDYNINLVGETGTIENGFVKVLDSATGFMLVKKSVLETMAQHYSKDLLCVNDLPGDRSDPGYPTEYVALFDCMIDPLSRRYLSEDYAFSRRAQALGFEVWADVTAPLAHIGNYTFGGDISERFKMTYSH